MLVSLLIVISSLETRKIWSLFLILILGSMKLHCNAPRTNTCFVNIQ